MGTRDLLRLVLANLNRMRTRVMLTAIGVIIGTAAVIVLISLGVGLQTNATRQLSDFGEVTEITVFQGQPFGRGTGAAAQKKPGVVLNAKAIDAIRGVPHVAAVSPEEGLQGNGELKLGRKTTFANLQGMDPKAAEKWGWKLAAGAPRLGRGQIVIGQQLFDNQNGPILISAAGPAAVSGGSAGAAGISGTAGPLTADQLQGRTVFLTLSKVDDENKEIKRVERLRVAGVFEKTGRGDDFSVYLALDDLQGYNQWFSGKRRSAREGYNSIKVRVDARENVSGVQDGIRTLGFTNMFSAQDILQSLNQFFVIMQAILGGIGAIALLVAAFGIANTMTMAIYERTKEIGIMKAIGATNRDVLQIFLSEAAAIGLFGGIFGVGLGWGVGKLIDIYIQGMQQAQPGNAAASGQAAQSLVVTPVWLMLFSLVFATFIGAVSGIYPALRAASMKPLRALRTD